MNFLHNILKNVISRIKNELLLFALATIILIILFPENRYLIVLICLVISILYSIIKIINIKPITTNQDVITNRDWPVVKERIIRNLKIDSEKLNILIPLLGDDSHSKTIDEKNKINSSLEALSDRLHHLTASARSKIDNEEEIDLIRNWIGKRDEANKQLSMIRRVEYINEKESLLKDSLARLIHFYEKMD